MIIKKFNEFIKESVLSEPRYTEILADEIESDDTLREYCECEKDNICSCDGYCECKFCNLYNGGDKMGDEILSPSQFDNSLSGKTLL